MVFCRFGITSRRFEHRLNTYIAVTRNLGCTPTFCITAITLKRHPEVIRKISKQGIEFAVHGNIHTDHKLMSSGEQTRHFQQAIDTFKTFQIPFTGFRAPYLRISNETHEVLNKLEFLYDSSYVIHWDVVDQGIYPRRAWREYNNLLNFYQAHSAQDYLVLPRFTNGITEIPVSIPDDEAIIDRLGLRDENKIANVWSAILEQIYNRGELFAIQLHPERISVCGNALANVLRQAKVLKPPIWIATLGEIAQWWKEREGFRLEVNSEGNGKYRVTADCSEKATLLLKNCKTGGAAAELWYDGYQSISARDFVVESSRSPVIGVGLDSSPQAVNFLRSEGFVVEPSDQPDKYGLYLNDIGHFHVTDVKPLSEKVERSKAPLLRYWRWPYQAKCALSITGDIDSITLLDFALRIYETWRQNRR